MTGPEGEPAGTYLSGYGEAVPPADAHHAYGQPQSHQPSHTGYDDAHGYSATTYTSSYGPAGGAYQPPPEPQPIDYASYSSAYQPAEPQPPVDYSAGYSTVQASQAYPSYQQPPPAHDPYGTTPAEADAWSPTPQADWGAPAQTQQHQEADAGWSTSTYGRPAPAANTAAPMDPQATAIFTPTADQGWAAQTAAMPAVGDVGAAAHQHGVPEAPGAEQAEAPDDGAFDYLYRSDATPPDGEQAPTPVGERAGRTPTATRMLAPPTEAPARARTRATEPAPAEPELGGRAARRRAERRPRNATVGSRVALAVGELLMTTGALALLFVIYQLWWTNVLADKDMSNKGAALEQQWAKSPALSPLPNDAFAFMYIPRLGSDYRKVVMQGVDKNAVLDKGAIGHYTETAMPGAVGNFSVAAHRNTHGEPFRYLNTLQPGDKVVIETGTNWYTYQLDKELPQTSPSNVGVIGKVPKGGPYTKPGDYITLTTCTPDFTSWYRLIWWGRLVSTQPRTPSGPMPAALAGYTGPR